MSIKPLAIGLHKTESKVYRKLSSCHSYKLRMGGLPQRLYAFTNTEYWFIENSKTFSVQEFIIFNETKFLILLRF